jgi:hypothetical protein
MRHAGRISLLRRVIAQLVRSREDALRPVHSARVARLLQTISACAEHAIDGEDRRRVIG